MLANFTFFYKETNIKDANENSSAQEMVKELSNDQTVIIKTLQCA